MSPVLLEHIFSIYDRVYLTTSHLLCTNIHLKLSPTINRQAGRQATEHTRRFDSEFWCTISIMLWLWEMFMGAQAPLRSFVRVFFFFFCSFLLKMPRHQTRFRLIKLHNNVTHNRSGCIVSRETNNQFILHKQWMLKIVKLRCDSFASAIWKTLRR